MYSNVFRLILTLAIGFGALLDISLAQDLPKTKTGKAPPLLPVRVDGKEGYIDLSGKWVVEPGYEQTKMFSGGLGAFKAGGKWGFLDSSGKVIVSPRYDNTWPFSGNRGRVKLNDKLGFIDQKGKEVIPPKYAFAVDFPINDNLARIALHFDPKGDPENIIDKCGWIRRDGSVAIKPTHNMTNGFIGNYAPVKKGNRWGVINRSGKWIISPKFNFAISSPLLPTLWDHDSRPDLGLILLFDDKHRSGFLDTKGKLVWPFSAVPEIRGVSYQPLSDTHILGRRSFTSKRASDMVVLSRDGKVLWTINRDLDYTSAFYEGRAKIKSDTGYYGFIDVKGHEVIPAKFQAVTNFQNGLSAVKTGGKWGFCDFNGKMVVPPRFQWAGFFFYKNWGVVAHEGDLLWIDRTGKLLAPHHADE